MESRKMKEERRNGGTEGRNVPPPTQMVSIVVARKLLIALEGGRTEGSEVREGKEGTSTPPPARISLSCKHRTNLTAAASHCLVIDTYNHKIQVYNMTMSGITGGAMLLFLQLALLPMDGLAQDEETNGESKERGTKMGAGKDNLGGFWCQRYREIKRWLSRGNIKGIRKWEEGEGERGGGGGGVGVGATVFTITRAHALLYSSQIESSAIQSLVHLHV
jgi:hypothetical protein